MKRHTLAVLVGALLIGAAAMMPAHRSDSAARPTYHSAAAVALSPDGKLLYAADQTADAVVVIDTGSNAVAFSNYAQERENHLDNVTFDWTNKGAIQSSIGSHFGSMPTTNF